MIHALEYVSTRGATSLAASYTKQNDPRNEPKKKKHIENGLHITPIIVYIYVYSKAVRTDRNPVAPSRNTHLRGGGASLYTMVSRRWQRQRPDCADCVVLCVYVLRCGVPARVLYVVTRRVVVAYQYHACCGDGDDGDPEGRRARQ